jgi:hypothetical protein
VVKLVGRAAAGAARAPRRGGPGRLDADPRHRPAPAPPRRRVALQHRLRRPRRAGRPRRGAPVRRVPGRADLRPARHARHRLPRCPAPTSTGSQRPTGPTGPNSRSPTRPTASGARLPPSPRVPAASSPPSTTSWPSSGCCSRAARACSPRSRWR